MSRGLYRRGDVWWLSISVGGQRFRGSTGIRGGKPGRPPQEAELFRAQKLTEFGRGNMGAMAVDRVTVGSLIRSLLDSYITEKRPCRFDAEDRTRFLVEWYGGWKATTFTPDRARAYVLRRLEMKAAVATINSEIGYLRRAYSMGVDDRRIYVVPRFRRLPGANKRDGTISDADLELILAKLRPDYGQVIRFLRLTGWRENEGLGLEWWRVDFNGEQIRLSTSKTGRPRAVPWTTYPALGELLAIQRTSADAIQRERGVIVARVFHSEAGGPLTDSGLYNAWRRACIAAGVHGVPRADGTPTRPLIHDLRRTLNSEMDRRGVPWSVQKAVTGHESDRQHGDYVIAPRRDVEEGLLKLAGPSVPEVLAAFRKRGIDNA